MFSDSGIDAGDIRRQLNPLAAYLGPAVQVADTLAEFLPRGWLAFVVIRTAKDFVVPCVVDGGLDA